MPRTIVHSVQVEFGDCDPAAIVWFPNFFRWIDAASRHFFIACGVPRWEDTRRTHNILGTPIVDTHARFVMTASYGDRLDIHSAITEWRARSFVQHHRVMRGEADLIMECTEVRIFGAPREGGGLRALPIPPDLRALCE